MLKKYLIFSRGASWVWSIHTQWCYSPPIRHQLMFRRIYQHRELSRLIGGFVFLALWNGALVWAVCPHLNAKSQHCPAEDSSPSHRSLIGATISNEPHVDMALAEMGEDLPVSSSAHECAAALSQPGKSDPSATDIASFTGFGSIRRDAMMESPDSCSHCSMHSQSGVNSPSTAMGLNNYSSRNILPATSIIVSLAVSSPLISVDVHYHGPPGLSSSRFILNSSFRI